MKIAISGKMCAGKSFITNALMKHFNNNIKKKNLIKISFADDVYYIARNMFGMTEKNRVLLTSIATKMREIDDDVWAKSTILKVNKLENVIIDDLRFSNELNLLKKNKFFLIRINISKELQLQRLKKTYPNTFDQHLKKINHQSETALDKVSIKNFDLVFNINSEDDASDIPQKIINKLSEINALRTL